MSGPFPVLTIRVSIRYGASGTYAFHYNVFGEPCPINGGREVTLVAGQVQELSVPVVNFPTPSQVARCLPATSPTLELLLVTGFAGSTLISRRESISYNWIP